LFTFFFFFFFFFLCFLLLLHLFFIFSPLREDAGVDPNRDFPYSRQDSNCLQCSTSRLFHSIMRLNLIQIVVTFHGGMAAIGYEWGENLDLIILCSCNFLPTII
jgi:hypothetical protein